ncbi:MAG: Gfo/Idh/MocA family oxidoreductase [Opitutae bacterium]
MNRRSFLGKIGGAFPFLCLGQTDMAVREPLRVAAIGVGGKGGSDLQQLARHGELVAACDISNQKLDYALRNFPFTAKFSDYREMISHMGEKIDVLCISSPDHTHAHAAQLASNLGIHLFVQAPMAHTIWEVRQLVKGARQAKICTQIGMQGWASDRFRQAVEYLQTGELGQIEEVHVWTNRPMWPQSPVITKRPAEIHAIPAGLHWDGFIGPAEKRPYNKIYQPYNWRGWRAFGSGALGDVGVHLLNLPVMGCGLVDIQNVHCLLQGPVNEETYQAWGIVKYEFASHQAKAPIPLFWYEGRIGHLSKGMTGKENLPPAHLFHGQDPASNGCLIRGAQGSLYSPSLFGNKWEVHLGKKWLPPEELVLPSPRYPRNGRGDAGMKEELVRAIQSDKPELAMANFDSVSRVHELALLGNISLLAGGKFTWESTQCSSDRKDVNSLIGKSYRDGWEVRSV